jgi:hypothetical protein
VAVAEKGAPLMRFFKVEQPMSWEDETAAARLNAIAGRTRASVSPDMDERASSPKEEHQPESGETLQ